MATLWTEFNVSNKCDLCSDLVENVNADHNILMFKTIHDQKQFLLFFKGLREHVDIQVINSLVVLRTTYLYLKFIGKHCYIICQNI